MAGAKMRFRSLLSFHVDSYLYYCKHIQRHPWSPMRIVVVIGLASQFLCLAAVQAVAELSGLVAASSPPKAAR